MTTGVTAKNPHAIAREKEGRNSPCPCGSGLKYKKCCLLKIENSVQLKIMVTRGIKKKIQDIHADYFKDDISFFGFSKRIAVADKPNGEYLYWYHPTQAGKSDCDILLVKMNKEKIIVEELIRNGKTYAQYKADEVSRQPVGSEGSGV